MNLYVELDCDICKNVLRQIDVAADLDLKIIKPRKSLLSGSPTTYYVEEGEPVNTVPSLPALIDGSNVVVGDKILSYLASKPRTATFLINYGM